MATLDCWCQEEEHAVNVRWDGDGWVLEGTDCYLEPGDRFPCGSVVTEADMKRLDDQREANRFDPRWDGPGT